MVATGAFWVMLAFTSTVLVQGFDRLSWLRQFEPAFQTFTAAWKLFQPGRKSEWPSIKIQILEPPLGIKTAPPGVHPQKYIKELPELRDRDIADGRITYLDSNGEENTVSSQYDWVSYFQHLSHESAPLLRLSFVTPSQQGRSIWDRGYQAARVVSDTLRQYGKTLMFGESVKPEDINKELQFLESQGFSEFAGKGVVFEELGYDKEDWPRIIDNLVEAGVPSVWGKTLKLGAKAKRGSIKSLVTHSFKDGVRTMNYMKFQVLPDGRGGVDGLFAIYQLTALSSTETTGMRIEQSFKRYVELDAHQEWKKEVRQLLPVSQEEAGGRSGEL